MPNCYKIGRIKDNDLKNKYMEAECYRNRTYKGKYNFKDIKTMKDVVYKIDKKCREEKHSTTNVVIICSSILGALLFVCVCFFGWVYRCHIKHLYEKVMTVLYHHELFKKLVLIYSHIELNIKDGLDRSHRPDVHVVLMEIFRLFRQSCVHTVCI